MHFETELPYLLGPTRIHHGKNSRSVKGQIEIPIWAYNFSIVCSSPLDGMVVLRKMSHELPEGFIARQDGVTVVQRCNTFLRSRYLRTIRVNHRLLFEAFARFDGIDEFRGDQNLVKRRH